MKQYIELLEDILSNGVAKGDRTGTGTISVFGRMYRHDLADGFPLLTTKKLHIKSILHELLWFLQGDKSIKYLQDKGVSIWNEWAEGEDQSIGPLYGVQWRRWPAHEIIPNTTKDRDLKINALKDRGFSHVGTLNEASEYFHAKSELFFKEMDQVQALVESLKNNPNSRRHIINAWNVSYLPDERKSPQQNVREGFMALAPCPTLFQFYVADGKLHGMLTQRSGDAFLGVPYNCASLAFLTHMLAQQCDLDVGTIVHSLGDLHLYSNHLDQARIQVNRQPRSLPKLVIKRKPNSIFDYRFEDFEIEGYDPHPHIAAPIAI